MTPTELRDWMKRRGLTHAKAAELLCMSLDGLRKNIYGETPIGAQTAKIIELTEQVEKWKHFAEIFNKAASYTTSNPRPSE